MRGFSAEARLSSARAMDDSVRTVHSSLHAMLQASTRALEMAATPKIDLANACQRRTTRALVITVTAKNRPIAWNRIFMIFALVRASLHMKVASRDHDAFVENSH
jgi:hypothetical protein